MMIESRRRSIEGYGRGRGASLRRR
ncbi:unnamed protein product [Linum tenue]|uniref:Uncharacterized protein n=1 Tax=Linum tenue TaxID=586396 RepID=A0AAV0LJA7_9ROSI|nr:unnamed protein product [Linum tenue]